MGKLDVDFHFTNIPLEKTINNCREPIYDETDFLEGLNKSEFKNYCA